MNFDDYSDSDRICDALIEIINILARIEKKISPATSENDK